MPIHYALFLTHQTTMSHLIVLIETLVVLLSLIVAAKIIPRKTAIEKQELLKRPIAVSKTGNYHYRRRLLTISLKKLAQLYVDNSESASPMVFAFKIKNR